MEAEKKSVTIPFTLLWLGLLGFLLFYRLDFLPFRVWDESRQAVQVYEMRENGDYIVPRFESAPDMWNTKPPLLVWAQTVSAKIFGYGEWAIRFPVALCALLTCVVLLLYLKRVAGSVWPGFVAGLVLVTLNTYNCVHGSRTGDFDVPLTLFLTWAACSFFAYLQLGNRPKDLYLFFVALALAVLTKSVAGLFLLPAFGLFFVLGGYGWRLVFNRHFLGGLCIFLFAVSGYYLLREHYNPGYLQAVWNNEIGGRYGQALENHVESRWFYFNRMWHEIYGVWIWLFFAGLVYILTVKDKTFRRPGLFALLVFAQYLLLVTWAQTKLFWYDMPLYPFAAVVVAIPVYRVMRFLEGRLFKKFPAEPADDRRKEMPQTQGLRLSAKSAGNQTNHNFSQVFKPAFLFLLFAVPCFLTARRISRQVEPNNWDENFYALSAYLKQSLHDPSQRGDFKILYPDYRAHLMPYAYMYGQAGRKVEFVTVEEIKPGDTVLVNQPEAKEKIMRMGEVRIQVLNRTAEAVTLIR